MLLEPEELVLSPEDIELGEQLVREGWQSVSNKYRTVRRWIRTLETLDELIPQDLKCLPEAKWYIRLKLRPNLREHSLRDLMEERVLTIRQFKAFKRAGGGSA